MKKFCFALLLFLGSIQAALAVHPDEVLADPQLEARARAISRELRCLVCQNQSIDDSEADLARDLRLLVRQRLASGQTDQQTIDYVVARYGDFVLLRPPLNGETLALWFGPVVLLFCAAGAAFLFLRRRRAQEPLPLGDDEKRRLAELIGDDNK